METSALVPSMETSALVPSVETSLDGNVCLSSLVWNGNVCLSSPQRHISRSLFQGFARWRPGEPNRHSTRSLSRLSIQNENKQASDLGDKWFTWVVPELLYRNTTGEIEIKPPHVEVKKIKPPLRSQKIWKWAPGSFFFWRGPKKNKTPPSIPEFLYKIAKFFLALRAKFRL